MPEVTKNDTPKYVEAVVALDLKKKMSLILKHNTSLKSVWLLSRYKIY
jgi:hypothetical protein